MQSLHGGRGNKMEEKLEFGAGEVWNQKQILSSYSELADLTGVCIPNLRKLVNRRTNPLPSVRVSERKLCFVVADVLRWFSDESSRQAGGAA